MARLTEKEKILWNRAVKAAMNEAYLYDGLIPDEDARLNLKHNVIKKLSYKLKVK